MSSSEASDAENSSEVECSIPVSSYAVTKRERLRSQLEKYVFLDAKVVVEGIELPEEDIASGLDDDSDTSCEVTFDGYLLWMCENYQVEVRPDTEGTYRVRVDHKPFLRIRNSGSVNNPRELLEMCRFLEANAFEDAMKILFARKDGKLRTEATLSEVVSESWVRSTFSAFEP